MEQYMFMIPLLAAGWIGADIIGHLRQGKTFLGIVDLALTIGLIWVGVSIQ